MPRGGHLLAGLLGLLISPGLPWAQVPIGQVHATAGTVTCTRQQQVHVVIPGWVLQEGDTLTTGAQDSRVAVAMVDGTRFALGARSRLVLRHYTYNTTTQAGAMQAELPRGTLAVQSGKLGAREDAPLRVTTPQATVRVRDAKAAFNVKE